MDDNIKKILDQLDSFRAPDDTLAKLQRQLTAFESPLLASDIAKHTAISTIIEREVERLRANDGVLTLAASRAAMGPMSDIVAAAEKYSLRMSLQQESLLASAAASIAAFRLPEVSEASSLVARAMEFADAETQRERYKWIRTMEAIDTPWLRIGKELESTLALDRFLTIGDLVKKQLTFDDTVSARLRDILGDWRTIDIPANVEFDIGARTELYEQAGMDGTLTDLPNEAFTRELELAELDTEPPAAIVVYADPIPAVDTEEEQGFRRTNAAHNRLLRFESHLRRFIDNKMTDSVGANWIKQRLDPATRKLWEEKRDQDIANGVTPGPLIVYADFTDYERIILRGDNWKEIFHPVFLRQESVRESLFRLYPVRRCTMHARLLTHDDELLLHVEIKRLLRAIGVLK